MSVDKANGKGKALDQRKAGPQFDVLPATWDPASLDPEHPPSILILDQVDVNRRILRGILKNEPYRLVEAQRAPEALEILAREKIDLVILDLMMPGMSGPEFCQTLRSSRRTQFIPILMITSVQGFENEVAGIASGADEFLLKPLHPAVVRTRIRALLRSKSAIDSLEEAESILFALAQAVEHRDVYTAGHCHRLSCYSVSLGMGLGLPRPQLLALHRGGFLHDLGKIGVPDAILHKKGRLTEEEWAIMRTHPVRGENICRPMKSLQNVLPVIRSHHERWDGGGYPDGLRGSEIPLVARILQIADIYDALTTARPYKAAFSPERALGVLEKEASLGWRDPELVDMFRALHRQGRVPTDGAPLLGWPQLEIMTQSVSVLSAAPLGQTSARCAS
ncbi:MAG: HD-GYP domain-containing protein [Bryobacteraceae bacterium]